MLYFGLVVSLVITSAVMQPSSKFLKLALAQVEGKFITRLTGQDEVPPTNTKATGTADFAHPMKP